MVAVASGLHRFQSVEALAESEGGPGLELLQRYVQKGVVELLAVDMTVAVDTLGDVGRRRADRLVVDGVVVDDRLVVDRLVVDGLVVDEVVVDVDIVLGVSPISERVQGQVLLTSPPHSELTGTLHIPTTEPEILPESKMGSEAERWSAL